MTHLSRKICILFLSVMSIASSAQLTVATIDKEQNPNEPSVAIKPSSYVYSPIVAASNIDNFYLNPLSQLLKVKSTSKYGVYGDPVLHYSDTTLFFAHLSKTFGKDYGDWFDRIVVQKIANPYTWEETSYSVGYNDNKMQDKPWLSSDNHSDRYKGNVYVTWTEFDKYNSANNNDRSRIRFSRYDLKSDSFNTAITISDTTGDCLDGDSTLEGATTAVGNDGTIYATWAGLDYIWFDQSKDGGKTWGADIKIARQEGGWDMDMPNIMRANGMPFLVCDTTRDILYVTWADAYNGDADVWLMYSKDQGTTWSKRIKVNQDTTKRGQYFPNIAIDQATGEVFIAFYDFRYSSSESFYNIFLNRFTLERGLQENQITNAAIPLPGKNVFYGDYLDLDVHGNTLAVIYTTNDLSNHSKIEMASSHQYQKYLYDRKNGNITNSIGMLNQNDSLTLVCNGIHPYRLDVKIRISDSKNNKRKLKKSVAYRNLKTPQDHRILAMKLEDNEYIKKAKFTLIDYTNDKKQIVKIRNGKLKR